MAGMHPQRILTQAARLAALAAMSSLLGCSVILTQTRDLRDDIKLHMKNKQLAKDAWFEVEPVYADQPCVEDFRLGFLAGYADLASGKRGCPPALPPRRYWKVKYLGETERVMVWFDGYRHGVVVANQDGVAHIGRIPTSVPICPPTRWNVPAAPPDAASGGGLVMPPPAPVEVDAPAEAEVDPAEADVSDEGVEVEADE